MKVGAVNADDHQSLGGQYGVRGFPTIKVFGADKNKPTDYQGNCTCSSNIDMEEIQLCVNFFSKQWEFSLMSHCMQITFIYSAEKCHRENVVSQVQSLQSAFCFYR